MLPGLLKESKGRERVGTKDPALTEMAVKERGHEPLIRRSGWATVELFGVSIRMPLHPKIGSLEKHILHNESNPKNSEPGLGQHLKLKSIEGLGAKLLQHYSDCVLLRGGCQGLGRLSCEILHGITACLALRRCEW